MLETNKPQEYDADLEWHVHILYTLFLLLSVLCFMKHFLDETDQLRNIRFLCGQEVPTRMIYNPTLALFAMLYQSQAPRLLNHRV